MDRLTGRNEDGKIYLKKPPECDTESITLAEMINAISWRLANYEDAEESGEYIRVVRCKDCNCMVGGRCKLGIQYNHPVSHPDEDDYCSYGENKVNKDG